jgi:hypothetical protein
MPQVASRWTELNQRLLDETASAWREEPDEMRIMRLGLLANGAGSKDQYFTTIDFANGMMRDFPMYTMYPILRAAHSDTFSLEKLRELVRLFHPPYTEYLGYSGYTTLREVGQQFMSVLDDFPDKSSFIECYTNFLKYCNKLGAWSYHYFPWEVAQLYPQHGREWVEEAARLTRAQQAK